MHIFIMTKGRKDELSMDHHLKDLPGQTDDTRDGKTTSKGIQNFNQTSDIRYREIHCIQIRTK